jgi:transcriptional regulatory protein RtcR
MVTDMSMNIMYSFLGNQLDAGFQEKRWERWRPNVGISESESPVIDKLVLMHGPKDRALAQRVAADALVKRVNPHFQVELQELPLDPYDLSQTFVTMDELRVNTVFNPDHQYFLNITTGTHIMQIVCYMMVESKLWPGVLAQCGPTADRKASRSVIEVIDLDLRRYDKIMARYRLEDLKGELQLKQGIETRNPQFNAMVSKLQKIASKSRSPIVLMGPTGAGKTAMARRLHRVKEEHGLLNGEFVEVNCATLRGDTVMSTLFGHKKGAFTGALDNREGLLKKAHGGLLFLDEVGELGQDEQAMLLHALEDKQFTPVGSDKTVTSDFQLIVGTNRNLLQAVEEGTFRADLLARINTWSFTLPGLRDRLEDIEPNLVYELARLQEQHKVVYRMLPKAFHKYLAHATSPTAQWAGNFRDLTASVERMTTLAEKGIIDEQVVDEEIEMLQGAWHQGGPVSTNGFSLVERVLPAHQLNLFEQAQLNLVLTLCVDAKSYADLGRKVYGESVGKNPSQRVRDFLKDHDLTLDDVKTILSA